MLALILFLARYGLSYSISLSQARPHRKARQLESYPRKLVRAFSLANFARPTVGRAPDQVSVQARKRTLQLLRLGILTHPSHLSMSRSNAYEPQARRTHSARSSAPGPTPAAVPTWMDLGDGLSYLFGQWRKIEQADPDNVILYEVPPGRTLPLGEYIESVPVELGNGARAFRDDSAGNDASDEPRRRTIGREVRDYQAALDGWVPPIRVSHSTVQWLIAQLIDQFALPLLQRHIPAPRYVYAPKR